MKNTNWDSPHGLNNKESLTTVTDMFKLSERVKDQPLHLKVNATKVYRCTAMVEQDGNLVPGRNYTWISNMRMLGVDGFIGQKKGWTPPAGHCIALEYKKDGHHFSIVTINSKTKNTLWTEVQQLVSWAIWREK